ncbi:MAG TPA: hypothetical protein VFZ71_09255 [Pyrinomonadaceae bacterium]
MSNSNCLNCGIRNYAEDEICISCGAALTFQPSFLLQNEFQEWQPQVDPGRPHPGIRPFGVSNALSQTFSLFFRNLWLITKVVFVIVAPFEIFRALSLADVRDDWQLTAWTFFFAATSKVLIAPALIYAVMKVLQTGEAPGVHESYRWGLTKLVKLSLCALISWILQGLGYVFLIIPGIIVGLALAVVYPVAVLEKRSVAKTLARSAELTRGHRVEIFFAEFLLAMLLMTITVPAALFAAQGLLWPVTVIGSIAGHVLEQIGIILSLVMYLSLPRNAPRGHSVYALSK